MAAEQDVAAVTGCRRIYLGNILYIVQPREIAEVLTENGFGAIENIHISVDPLTARNPGYCFVDFKERADAERALSSLGGVRIRGRPVKVGPVEPKKERTPAHRGGGGGSGDGAAHGREPEQPTFNRWGDWSGERGDRRENEQGPYGAIEHFEQVEAADGDGRRLWIGGLPKMVNQAQNEAELREILAGFSPVAIGKRKPPHQDTVLRYPGRNLHYCFVDFQTAEEASAAIEAVNRREWNGYRLRACVANPLPDKLRDRTRSSYEPERRDNVSWREGPARPGQGAVERAGPRHRGAQSRSPERPARALASSNWRQRGADA